MSVTTICVERSALSAALLVAGSLELLHAAALAEGYGLCKTFAGSWCHELWFAHIGAVGIVCIGRPQTEEVELVHVAVGLGCLFGGHAITVEKGHMFKGQSCLTNPSIDPMDLVRWHGSDATWICDRVTCSQDYLCALVRFHDTFFLLSWFWAQQLHSLPTLDT